MIKTLVIDDEPLAVNLLCDYIARTDFLQLSGTFDNPLMAIAFMEENPVDLVFVDIQMPDLSGIDFVKRLSAPVKIIFTTAHEKYAIEGFKVDAIDYLLKPFSYEEFLTAAKKAQRLIELENKPPKFLEANQEFLFIKSDYKTRRINFNDIIYIEGLKDYVKIFLKDNAKPILTIAALKSLEAKLPVSSFMRVHRSFIVNLERIEVIEKQRIVFGEVHIPVSEQYKDKFQAFLDKNFL